MKKIASSALVAAAMTGLFAGSAYASNPSTATLTGTSPRGAVAAAGVQLAADDTKAPGTHDCKGKNSCKGAGGCKTGDNGCKGKNSCKGKGGCKTSSFAPRS